MMASAGDKGTIPDEAFAKKLSTCTKANMCKRLFADCSKVMHHPASITMNDFGDCYDRCAHTVQAIALRANGIPVLAVKMLLTALQTWT